MLIRIVVKYGFSGGLVIIMFAFLKSEWFLSGLYPDVFLTLIALVFAFTGMVFRHVTLKDKNKSVIPVEKMESSSRLDQLSRRELEVVEFLNSRYSNKEIAGMLNIELSTLKTHINSIYKKLGITQRKDLRLIHKLEPHFN